MIRPIECAAQVQYETLKEAYQELLAHGGLMALLCDHCGSYHIPQRRKPRGPDDG